MTNKERFLSGANFKIKYRPEVYIYKVTTNHNLGYLITDKDEYYCSIDWVNDDAFLGYMYFLGQRIKTRILLSNLVFE